MKTIVMIVFIAISVLSNCQKAFLLTSSVGYYNYRQIANTLEMYHWLKRLGFQDNNLNLLFPENVGCCQKNSIQGSISFRDGEYSNLNKNFELDYKYDTLNAESFGNLMVMKYPPHTLNFKKLKLDDEPYFIYLTGHGGDFYFKIRQRQALITQNFQHLFKDLSMRNNASVFLMSDSCSAITPFEEVQWQNFIALGSSSKGEKSLSMGYDKALNGPKSDEFTYYLSQHFNERNPVKANTTIRNIWQYLDYQKLSVHSKISTRNRRNRNKLLKQFIVREPRIVKFTKNMKIPQKFFDCLEKE